MWFSRGCLLKGDGKVPPPLTRMSDQQLAARGLERGLSTRTAYRLLGSFSVWDMGKPDARETSELHEMPRHEEREWATYKRSLLERLGV